MPTSTPATAYQALSIPASTLADANITNQTSTDPSPLQTPTPKSQNDQIEYAPHPIRWICSGCRRVWGLSAVHRCLHCSRRFSHREHNKPPITIFDADFWAANFHQRATVEIENTRMTTGWTKEDWADELSYQGRRRERRLAKGEGDCSKDCEYPTNCLHKRAEAIRQRQEGIRNSKLKRDPFGAGIGLGMDDEAMTDEDDSGKGRDARLLYERNNSSSNRQG